MKPTTLYKRDARGNILRWQIHPLDGDTFSVIYGIFGKKTHTEIINSTLKKVDEIKSRINAKRKEGYKALEDLWDNADAFKGYGSDFDVDNINLYKYLDTYLPKNNTTSEGFVLPMLAKTLEDNKPFDKFGDMLGQWKINGLRCLIGAKTDNDIFSPVKLTYHSRTGENWTSKMHWMDDIILSKLNTPLLDMMLEEGVYLDGELYLPGYTVNDINSFVKNPELPQHYKLQYWCYDIACENMSAVERNKFRLKNTTVSDKLMSRYEHLNNSSQFVVLPTIMVDSIDDAIKLRNDFISFGFEGLILRNQSAEYAFGKRNSSMFKFKKKEDGIFEIVDIKEDKRGLPVYTLRNDINDETFECTINLSQKAQRAQLQIKNTLIGKKGFVEYRERSGVKQVPFHAKLIKIYV